MVQKQLVLIGGGHAHMVTLANLNAFIEKSYQVTVIQPSDFHYYSGMGPGMLGGSYAPDHIRFATRKVVEGKGGRFIRTKARAIDPSKQVVLLENSDEEVRYDVLSCNAGSYVPRDTIREDETIFTVKPIEGLLHAQQEIVKRGQYGPLNIGIVGGGPSSVEVAGNVWQLVQDSVQHPVIIRIFAGKALMAYQPKRIGTLARKILKKRGVEILEGSYVKKMGQGKVVLEDGRIYDADLLFPAVGVKPSPIFSRSGLPTGPDGGLLVNDYLQCTDYSNIFGGGDCIYFQSQPLDKVGVYAVRENPILYHNLMASLSGGTLQSFDPGGDYLLIYNLGGKKGIFCKRSIIFSGSLAFWIKDYIDRKFIRKFQALEKTH